MDAADKRRLKKLGKQRVEEKSRELRDRLAESNPAPVGSDEWVRHYRQATLKGKELRQEQPDVIYASEIQRDFVVNPIEPAPIGVPTYYVRCVQCGDALHSCPTEHITCSCGRLNITRSGGQTKITAESHADVQWVKLIARGTAKLGFENKRALAARSTKRWWQFWKLLT
jgi:hypothetical protein